MAPERVTGRDVLGAVGAGGVEVVEPLDHLAVANPVILGVGRSARVYWAEGLDRPPGPAAGPIGVDPPVVVGGWSVGPAMQD